MIFDQPPKRLCLPARPAILEANIGADPRSLTRAHAPQMMLLGAGAAAIVYTTWNPSDKGAATTLSNGNLTATNSTSLSSVRSVKGVTSGKWYWEVTIGTSDAGNNHMPGVANASANLASYPGSDVNGWAYYGHDGTKYHNNVSSAYGSTFTAGDVIGVAFDADNGILWFSKNGTWQNSATISEVQSGTTTHAAYTGITGTTFYAFWGGGSAVVLAQTTNFGASAFAATVPTGFSGLH